MASWIGASPSQRFWQYTLPAARRAIASGEWDRCIADYDRQIADAQADLAAQAPDTFAFRQRQRRIAGLERDRDSCIASRARDLDTIAEGERRKGAGRR